MDFFKIKKDLLFKRHCKENEKPIHRLEVNICNISTKILYSKYIKYPCNSIISSNPIKNIWLKYFNRPFIKEYMQISNNYIVHLKLKRCWISIMLFFEKAIPGKLSTGVSSVASQLGQLQRLREEGGHISSSFVSSRECLQYKKPIKEGC